MRLLNTETHELHDFTARAIPEYVVLSHRWTDEEVSFKEFSKGQRQDSNGHEKIVRFCEFLKRWKMEWAWIDTVCIDKRSSAELSEAINSMYKWYSNAKYCFAFLHDVSGVSKDGSAIQLDDMLQQFSESVWFERGWTLQELVAPMHVVFCTYEWEILGCKLAGPPSRNPLKLELDQAAILFSDVVLWAVTQRTGIPDQVLLWPPQIQYYSVAQKMSWASRRQTTRVEDKAYCLLGLFRINMPLLYGEGDRAFQRLQHEIIRTSHDESIYAWTSIGNSYPPYHLTIAKYNNHYSILARSPHDFADSGDIVRTLGIQRAPWTVTHHGLEVPLVADNHNSSIELPGFNVPGSSSSTTPENGHQQPSVALSFPLACKRQRDPDSSPCKIMIARLGCAHWGRVVADNLMGTSLLTWKPTTIKFERQKVYIHIDECEDLHLDAAS